MKFKHSIFALLVLLSPGFQAWADNSDEIESVKFEKFVSPIYPYGLTFEGVVDGDVEIAVDINKDGTIDDWFPLRSSHVKFTREIGRVIDQWVFKPILKDGVAIPMVLHMSFHFTFQGVISLTAGDLSHLFFNPSTGGSEKDRLVFNLSELDRIPTPIEVAQPKGVLGLDPEAAVGRVMIEFIIDTEGNVRLPVVREIEGPIELAYTAFDSISSWKFEPPVRNNRIVSARVRQSFVFSPVK